MATNAPRAACLRSTRFEQFRGTRQAKKSFLMACWRLTHLVLLAYVARVLNSLEARGTRASQFSPASVDAPRTSAVVTLMVYAVMEPV